MSDNKIRDELLNLLYPKNNDSISGSNDLAVPAWFEEVSPSLFSRVILNSFCFSSFEKSISDNSSSQIALSKW